MSASRSARTRSGRRHRPGWMWPLVWSLAIVIALVGIVSVVALLHAVRLEKRVDTLPTIIQNAETSAEDGQLLVAQQDLTQAQNTLTAVNSSLYNSPDFAVVDLLPVARQNIDAIRNSVALGLQMIGGGEQILRAAAPLESASGHLDVPLDHGQVPLASTEAVATAITSVLTTLPASADPPSQRFVLGRVHSLQERIYGQAIKRRQELQTVGAALQLLDDMAGANGDHRYLIAVANSAEMRGSGGMILSYGVITSHAGTITLGNFGNINELTLTQPETKVIFPSDFTKSYQDLGPTLNWRNANMMSDFTIDAPVLEAMYAQATGLPVDGVIQVDSAGLGAILAGTGPVQTADLGQVTAANVVPLTLSQAYQLYPNRQVRQDYSGEVAQAAFAQLLSGRFAGLRPLGAALVQAGKDRHVLMYTSDPTDESILGFLGFNGALPAPSVDFAQLTVQNFGANKLDYYLRSSVSLTGTPPSDLGSQMTATIDLSNGAPVGQTSPVEVFGPNVPGGQAGEYEGLVTLYVPHDSYLRASQTDSSVTTAPAQSTQNGVTTITFTVSMPAGTGSQVVLHIAIPPTSSRTGLFEFVPTPRVIPTAYLERFA